MPSRIQVYVNLLEGIPITGTPWGSFYVRTYVCSVSQWAGVIPQSSRICGVSFSKVDQESPWLTQVVWVSTLNTHHCLLAVIQFNSIQFNSIQFNSIQFNSIQFNLRDALYKTSNSAVQTNKNDCRKTAIQLTVQWDLMKKKLNWIKILIWTCLGWPIAGYACFEPWTCLQSVLVSTLITHLEWEMRFLILSISRVRIEPWASEWANSRNSDPSTPSRTSWPTTAASWPSTTTVRYTTITTAVAPIPHASTWPNGARDSPGSTPVLRPPCAAAVRLGQRATTAPDRLQTKRQSASNRFHKTRKSGSTVTTVFRACIRVWERFDAKIRFQLGTSAERAQSPAGKLSVECRNYVKVV